MGKEQEWKLAVPAASLFDEILAWEEIRRRMTEAPRRYHMQTSYYDTPDGLFSRERMTVRRRLENETSVVCVKAPLAGAEDPSVRGEWELEGTDVFSALPRLVALGAPAVLLEVPELICRWKADFQRLAVLLRMDDGSLAELALDAGALSNAVRSVPLCELELEMKAGGPEGALTLLEALQTRFPLPPLAQSKVARAKALDGADGLTEGP